MNSNRQLMKDRLEDLQADQKRLRQKARSNCERIIRLINPALSEIVDMNVASGAAAMDELVMAQAELLTIQSKIAQLEEALYG